MCVDELDAEALLEFADMMGYDGDDDEGAIEFVVELAESGEPEAMKLLGMSDD